MSHQEYALIVAGGKGTRFGGPIPKQFLELNGKPVLLHAVDAFYRYSSNIQIVVVLPREDMDMWQEIGRKYQLKSVIVQEGGSTRFQSVRKGLERVPDDSRVAIHDGVRPLVTPAIIATSFALAERHGCSVAAVQMKESLRMVTAQSGSPTSTSLDRSLYRIVQTPQTFQAALIKRAYQIQEDPMLTDDASVAERAGYPVVLFDGDYRNIKITNREDLAIAKVLLAETAGM